MAGENHLLLHLHCGLRVLSHDDRIWLLLLCRLHRWGNEAEIVHNRGGRSLDWALVRHAEPVKRK